MRPRADFRCESCGHVETLELQGDHEMICANVVGEDEDGEVICQGVMDRVWTAPHMGQMSSGEPPR